MLDRNNTLLMCIDVQGVLFEVMHAKKVLSENLKKLLNGCKALDVPILWTEQNPRRLGPTIKDLAAILSENSPVSKMSFSCLGDRECLRQVEQSGAQEVLLSGIEAHICVYQTAMDLLGRGYRVQVIADCVSSRDPENKQIGLEKVREAGGQITAAEIVLFELLKTAEAPQFKEISKIIR